MARRIYTPVSTPVHTPIGTPVSAPVNIGNARSEPRVTSVYDWFADHISVSFNRPMGAPTLAGFTLTGDGVPNNYTLSNPQPGLNGNTRMWFFDVAPLLSATSGTITLAYTPGVLTDLAGDPLVASQGVILVKLIPAYAPVGGGPRDFYAPVGVPNAVYRKVA